MKNLLIIAICAIMSLVSNAQNVGVGTAAPSEKLEVKATFENPRQFSEGLMSLWINGQRVFEDKEGITNEKSGQVIRRRPDYK